MKVGVPVRVREQVQIQSQKNAARKGRLYKFFCQGGVQFDSVDLRRGIAFEKEPENG